jgi:hypothetical protein
MVLHRLYTTWTASAKAEHELEEKKRNVLRLLEARKSRKDSKSETPQDGNSSAPHLEKIVTDFHIEMNDLEVTEAETEEFDVDKNDLRDLKAFADHKKRKESKKPTWFGRKRFTFKTAWEEKETRGLFFSYLSL